MQIFRELKPLRTYVAALRAQSETIALAPTMGALHAGHMALVAEGRRRGAAVIASIFVNPIQFGAGEDLACYPRREALDAAMLEAGGVAALWAPDVAAMYPDGPGGLATRIRVAGLSETLCGAARPGHFDGVATVVAKLLNQIGPDVALFGEKDYQQLAIIRRMVADLDIAVEIAGVATQRDADGVALSSRNAYLTDAERIAARTLPRALGTAAGRIAAGALVVRTLSEARAALAEAGFAPIDYVALCDAETLVPIDRLDRPARILAAARLGTTRLIDNMPVLPED